MIIQLEESLQKLRAMREDMNELAQALKISEHEKTVEELEKKTFEERVHYNAF